MSTKKIQIVGSFLELKVDSTLAQSGQAADAKATGDAINSLQVNIDEVSNLVGTNAVSEQIATAIANKSDTNHNHDDIYYTKVDVDAKFNEIDVSVNSVNGKTGTVVLSASDVGAPTVAEMEAAIPDDLADLSSDSTHRTVTDAEKETWNAKSNFSGNYNDLTNKPSIPSIDGLATVVYVDEQLETKSDSTHNHDSDYDAKGEADKALASAKGYTDTKTANLASTAVVDNKISTHNTSTAAHSDIRDLISALTTKLNNFLDVDDATTDQLSEVITIINNNKGTLESLTTSKVNVSDIIDNLTTSNASKVLSAKQGVALKALIDALQSELDSHTHSISEVSGLQSALDGKAASSHGTHVSYSSTAPVMDGTASVGSATTVSRSDHKHPTDTSRAAQTALDSHTSNTTVHITSTERSNWNAAKTHADSAHAPSDAEKNQNAFSNIAVSGQTTVAADTATDTVTFAGSNVSITTNATSDTVTFTVANGSTSAKGVVKLENSTSSTSTTTAATPSSVKSAYDLANTAKTAAATVQTNLDTHIANKSNPHSVTLSQLGVNATVTELNYVDGVTSAIQTQLNGKAPTSHASTGTGYGIGTGSNYGHVKLSDATNSTSAANAGIAASPAAVKAAYDLANSKANASHGNHVPTTQTANNATFLRNDNTWQKVTPANIGAATSAHDHKYAGSSSAGGAANSANKLTTARNISLSGDVTGSASFDGSANAAITVTRRRCVCGQTSSTATNPYYKFASIKMTAEHEDREIVFKVSTGYSKIDASGILRAHVRTSSAKKVDGVHLYWEYANAGIDPSKFIIAYPKDTESPTIELWVNVDSSWMSYQFDVIQEHTRMTHSNHWVLYNTQSAGSASAITSGYTQVASTLINIKNNAATATKVGTSTVGSATQPVYINNGTPTACTYSLSKSVPSDAKFTDTIYTHPTYTARTGKPTGNQTPAFGGTATVSQITSDATGHVTAATDRTITIPSTLSNGTGTAGLIKTTSTVTSNSGYTACPVISGVPYYKASTLPTLDANGVLVF